MKVGRKAKSAAIEDGFNQDKPVMKKDISAAKRQAAIDRRNEVARKRRAEKKEEDAKFEIARLAQQIELVKERAGYDPNDGVEVPEDDLNDAKSAYQMLQDMRWVYRQIKGRDKLKKLIKGDDRQFVFMVKELMKIEAALMSAKIRKEGDTSIGNQNFFVVLKGLEDDKQIIDQFNKNLDIKQITNAVNPDGSEYADGG